MEIHGMAFASNLPLATIRQNLEKLGEAQAGWTPILYSNNEIDYNYGETRNGSFLSVVSYVSRTVRNTPLFDGSSDLDVVTSHISILADSIKQIDVKDLTEEEKAAFKEVRAKALSASMGVAQIAQGFFKGSVEKVIDTAPNSMAVEALHSGDTDLYEEGEALDIAVKGLYRKLDLQSGDFTRHMMMAS